jgi:hypothetical protein
MPMQPEPAQLEEFARRYAAAWCSHDPANVAAFFSVNGSLTVNSGVPAEGRHEITAVAESFISAFPDLRVTMDKLIVGPDYTEFHWTLTGANTGPGGSGHRVCISGFEVWRIGADGLILSSQGHFDNDDYRHQLEHSSRESK